MSSQRANNYSMNPRRFFQPYHELGNASTTLLRALVLVSTFVWMVNIELSQAVAQTTSDLTHLEIVIRNKQRGIDTLGAAISTGRNQVTGEPLQPGDAELFQRIINEDTKDLQRMQKKADAVRQHLIQHPPTANSNNVGRARGADTIPNELKPTTSGTTQPFERPVGNSLDNNTRPTGEKPPTSSGTRPVDNSVPAGPPESSLRTGSDTRAIRTPAEPVGGSTSGSGRSTRPLAVPEGTRPSAGGVRGSVLGGTGLGVMGIDLAARGLEVYSGERTPGEAGEELVSDYATGAIVSTAVVGGGALVGGLIGGIAGLIAGNVPGAIAGGIAGAQAGGKVAGGIMLVVGAHSAGERMGESMARYHLQQEAFNQYRQDLLERHPELKNAPADELEEIAQAAMESDYLANNKQDQSKDPKSGGFNWFDGLISQASDAADVVRDLGEGAFESVEAETEQQVLNNFNDDPLAAATEAMALAAQADTRGATSSPVGGQPEQGVDELNLAQLLQQLDQSSNRTSKPDEPKPDEVELAQRPDEISNDEGIHPPITPPIGGGTESDFTSGNRPAEPSPTEKPRPLFVPPLIDNNPWLVTDDDIRSIRQGVNQTIANRVAGENYRTDADRQEAARLEGLLRTAETRLRLEMEKLERQRQRQINEALIEQQRQRVAAWYRQWYAAQNAYRNHQQQRAVPTQGSQGHQSGGKIQDPPR